MPVAPDIMRADDPESYPGKPSRTAHPDHQPIVPRAGGVPPWCTCGWRPTGQLGDPLLGHHLREVDPTYGNNTCMWLVTISKLIEQLRVLQAEFGDLPVRAFTEMGQHEKEGNPGVELNEYDGSLAILITID